MKKIDLPEYAQKFKVKGYDVKKVGNTYYQYKVDHYRVEGKSYPLSKLTYIGKIDEKKGLIKAYTQKDDVVTYLEYEKFKYLMDKLNDRLNKKDLGAFYTPIPYCQKAKELVELAIANVPKGNDYIILDRCAGTGNLESMLSDEQLLGSIYDEHILGYFVGRGFGISNPNLNFNLVRLRFSDSHGFYVTEQNYYKKMVILSIKHYLMFCRDWMQNEFMCCSADKGFEYETDSTFLKSCFIFGCLDYYNKCLSFKIDNMGLKETILNQLCFDDDTIANKKLQSLKLNKDEKQLIELYDIVLREAKKLRNIILPSNMELIKLKTN